MRAYNYRFLLRFDVSWLVAENSFNHYISHFFRNMNKIMCVHLSTCCSKERLCKKAQVPVSILKISIKTISNIQKCYL